jgi:hypothetical protein
MHRAPCDLVDRIAVTRILGPLEAAPRIEVRTDGRACRFRASGERTFVLFVHPAGFLTIAAKRFAASDVTVGDGVVSVQGPTTAAVLLSVRDVVVGVYGPTGSFAQVAELAELVEVAIDRPTA